MNTREDTRKILELLSEQDIPFVLLRGYDFLFDRSAEVPRDIDMLVPYDAMKKMMSFFQEQGFYSTFAPGHCGFAKRDGNSSVAFDIQPGHVREKNIPYLDYDSARCYEQRIEGIPVIGSIGLAFHLIVHSLIGKGRFKKEHKAKLRSITGKDTEKELQQFLRGCFGRREASRIITAISKRNFAVLEGRKWEYSARFLIYNPGAFLKFLTYGKVRFKRLLRRGKIISFIGLDGTGKTTLALSLVELLRARGSKAKYIYMGRLRGHALPMDTISKKIGVSKLEKKRKPPKLYLVARELAYYSDLLARYFFIIFPRTLTGTTMVCDRYAYDFYLDKYLSALSKFLFRFLYPRPTILIFLDAPEEEIIRRKNEYDTDTRRFLLNRWREVERVFKAKNIVSDNIEKNSELVYQWFIQSTQTGSRAGFLYEHWKS